MRKRNGLPVACFGLKSDSDLASQNITTKQNAPVISPVNTSSLHKACARMFPETLDLALYNERANLRMHGDFQGSSKIGICHLAIVPRSLVRLNGRFKWPS